MTRMRSPLHDAEMNTTPSTGSPSNAPSKQEFDNYAADYGAGMDNPVKGILGDSADSYLAVKLRWLFHRYPELRAKGAAFRVLDYGCGAATMLRLMTEAGLHCSMSGCDVSVGMLQEAERRWPANWPRPALHLQNGAKTRFASGSFDLVLITAVLHHVMPKDRPDVYAEIHRLLPQGGRVVVFEHNPINPLTSYVVARTPIDQNAILLRAGEVVAALRRTGFSGVATRYLMFLPPRLRLLGPLELGLGWLPLGAQYAVSAQRA